LAIPERICEDWCAGVVQKIRKPIDNKVATVANAIKHEFMHKYITIFNSCIPTNHSHLVLFAGMKSQNKLPALQQLQLLWQNVATMEIFCVNSSESSQYSTVFLPWYMCLRELP